MSVEAENFVAEAAKGSSGAALPSVTAALPPPVVLTQCCAAVVRAYLNDANLGHYQLFHAVPHDLYDIERSLEELGEVCAWESAPPLITGGEVINTFVQHTAKLRESGIIRLAKHEVVLARWYWIDAEDR